MSASPILNEDNDETPQSPKSDYSNDLTQMKPPNLTIQTIDLDYKTPPLQSNMVFDSINTSNNIDQSALTGNKNLNLSSANTVNNQNITNFSKVDNVPTPKIKNAGNSNNSSLRFNTNIENLVPLVVPKSRQSISNSKIVLNESKNAQNTTPRSPSYSSSSSVTMNERVFSEFKPDARSCCNSNSTKTFEDLKNTSSADRKFLMQHKPINRLVSLPVHRHNFLTNNNGSYTDNLVVPKTEPSVPAHAHVDKEYNIHDSAKNTYYLNQIETFDINTNEKQVWNISYEIGSGSFSKVYLTTAGNIVLKITDTKFNKDANKSEELKLRIQNSLTREVEILKTLKHPNIIKLLGTDKTSTDLETNRIIMALEYCKGGTLFSLIKEKRFEMPSELIRAIFGNIVSGILYMHSLDICHRDIKLENILLKYTTAELLGQDSILIHKPIIVISDFGLSKKIDQSDPLLSTRCGSEDYVSPELLLGMKYDGKQNDCWSLGVVLYTMLEGRLPFDLLPNEKQSTYKRNSKSSHRIASISWSWYIMKDEELSNEFKLAKKIVHTLLAKRTRRADIYAIKENDWCKPYIIE